MQLPYNAELATKLCLIAIKWNKNATAFLNKKFRFCSRMSIEFFNTVFDEWCKAGFVYGKNGLPLIKRYHSHNVLGLTNPDIIVNAEICDLKNPEAMTKDSRYLMQEFKLKCKSDTQAYPAVVYRMGYVPEENNKDDQDKYEKNKKHYAKMQNIINNSKHVHCLVYGETNKKRLVVMAMDQVD